VVHTGEVQGSIPCASTIHCPSGPRSRRKTNRQVADKKKILTTIGQPAALAKDEKTADEVAKRLNADADRQEEDRWSA
jgi:hypothetical protein